MLQVYCPDFLFFLVFKCQRWFLFCPGKTPGSGKRSGSGRIPGNNITGHVQPRRSGLVLCTSSMLKYIFIIVSLLVVAL